MPNPIIRNLACVLAFCLCAAGGVAAQDSGFFVVPPFVFRAPPDFMMADQPAGFCFAKTTDNRAYLLVALRNPTRTIDATERELDRLARYLGLKAESFECPPKAFGSSLLMLLSESGKELWEFVVPDVLLGAPRRLPPRFHVEPPPRNLPIARRP